MYHDANSHVKPQGASISVYLLQEGKSKYKEDQIGTLRDELFYQTIWINSGCLWPNSMHPDPNKEVIGRNALSIYFTVIAMDTSEPSRHLF